MPESGGDAAMSLRAALAVVSVGVIVAICRTLWPFLPEYGRIVLVAGSLVGVAVMIKIYLLEV